MLAPVVVVLVVVGSGLVVGGSVMAGDGIAVLAKGGSLSLPPPQLATVPAEAAASNKTKGKSTRLRAFQRNDIIAPSPIARWPRRLRQLCPAHGAGVL